MQRREFIAIMGGSAFGWPLAAGAQQTAMPVIGFLGSASPELWAARLRSFYEGLSGTGYADGRNVLIEYRWADGQNDRLPALATDLVRRQVTVITALGSTPAAIAAKMATSTIPIVFEIASNPIELGLVGSLARPGGNVTGVTTLNAEVEPKRLELLHELVPTATSIALLVNPTNPTLAENSTKVLQANALKLGVQLNVLQASTDLDFDAVFASIARPCNQQLGIGLDCRPRPCIASARNWGFHFGDVLLLRRRERPDFVHLHPTGLHAPDPIIVEGRARLTRVHQQL